MNYSKSALRDQAQQVLDLHKQSHLKHEEKAKAQYEKDLKRWKDKEKQETIDALTAALAKVRKDESVNGYALRSNLLFPPSKPKPADCCSPVTQQLDTFIALLDSISDEQVSSNALSMAGFKDLNRLLRRPC